MHPLRLPTHSTTVADVLVPAGATPAGYAALIAAFRLQVPVPDEIVAIGDKHTLRREGRWRVLTPRYRPAPTVAAHVEFALRHEGVDLGVLNALFQAAPREFIEEWVRSEPTGQHARRIWFLYEWLTGARLDLPDAPKAPYARVLDDARQFAARGEPITRHRIRNNLPGTPEFCPLVRRSEILNVALQHDLAEQARMVVQRAAPDLRARAAAFLLLEDSRASYVIEGERPPQDRMQRWGQAIGEAGHRPLTADEFLRLQRIVIGDTRFMRLGWRTEGGFVGSRDRETNAPLPDHISARPDDIITLIDGLISYANRSERGGLDPVIAAAAVAFGFVFIHPFEDGNGRIHRWLVHHMLGRRGFNPPGVILPVSAILLERIDLYRVALEHYSRPRLALTQWETTGSLNVRVLNATRDHFRFFDATAQAEFLTGSIVETVRVRLPHEIEYLGRYDRAKRRIEAFLELPDARLDLMVGFLRQNGGRLSRRARTREFAQLTDEEVASVEGVYQDLLLDFDRAGPRPASAAIDTDPSEA
jgi:Fic family protein